MNVYSIEGKVKKDIELPNVFAGRFRRDIVMRAILSEQSKRYQPQGNYLLAGLQTTAVYVGKYSAAYRRGRHMGIAIRPRQKLGGGAMGDVRRIPSAVKGRRAHPHKIEKILEERINSREYALALKSAVAGCSDSALIRARYEIDSKDLPLVVEDGIEQVSKSKELVKIIAALGASKDLEKSHAPKIRKGLKRLSGVRKFRKSVLIVSKSTGAVERAGRNIPGVDVCPVNELTVEKLAPGGEPRLSIWTEGALSAINAAISEEAIKKRREA
jgi:large subunit ribosomal protein L4e